MTDPSIVDALAAAASALESRGKRFALVGGLAVSVRGEVRFTRDVDLAVDVTNDAEAEGLVFKLREDDYRALVSVEHETRERLSTVRLMSPLGVKVDLLFASCGIESEVIERATTLEIPGAGTLPVACAEELLAMKVLSMTDRRLQDRIDARALLVHTADLDLERVRENLALIGSRGFERNEDLDAKLQSLLDEAR